MLCHCSVESNPKAAVTWSVNGSVPPDDYNVSMASEPHNLTATLQGRMDRPQRVVCFAVNALGNDSLVLLQGEEGLGVISALFSLKKIGNNTGNNTNESLGACGPTKNQNKFFRSPRFVLFLKSRHDVALSASLSYK